MNNLITEDIFNCLKQISTRLEALEREFLKSNNNHSDSGGELSCNNSKSRVNNCLDDKQNSKSSALSVYKSITFKRKQPLRINNEVYDEPSSNLDTAKVDLSKTTSNCFMGSKRNLLYTSLWMIMNAVTITVSVIYIKNAYSNWQSSPVVQALSNNQVHFDNVSFPAITICWANTLDDGYEFVDNIEKCLDCKNNTCSLKNNSCSYSDMATLALAHIMCPKYATEFPLPEEYFNDLPKAIEGNEFNTYMEKLFPSCATDEIVIQKHLKDPRKHTRCDTLFQQFYTSNTKRLCMTYNSLRFEDIFKENVVTPVSMRNDMANLTLDTEPSWTFDTMMEFKGGLDTVPIYGLEAVYILLTKQNRRYANFCSLYGIDLNSVIIHSPNELPLDNDNEVEYVISENTMLDLFVVPTITLARDDLAQYPPQQRGCLFSHEKNLTMFKFYTKKNCEVECIVNGFLQSCGCVPYVYPRQNDSVKVCLKRCPRPKYRCECLPECNSLTYDIMTQDSSITPAETNHTPRALVEVMLWGNKYYTKVRYSVTSYAEFLAYSLGVLGVFCGFSIKCVWDLMYFGTLGLWTSIKALQNKKISPL